MSILTTFNKYIVRQRILMRMSASEFYFKQPYDVKEEYPIMTSILGLSLIPIFLIFVFLYARIYGSLQRYNFPIILSLCVLSFGIAFLMIQSIKNTPFIDDTIRNYESMDSDTRKKIYSFKNGFKVTCIIGLLPWIVLGLAVAIICYVIPHS